jgi:hypothetical protein
VIRIRSELVKYFFLRRRSVGELLVDCNFLLHTAVNPHIGVVNEEEGLMGFQFGVHVLADLGLSLSHARGHSC